MAILTCHTQGCGNAEIPIELAMSWTDDEGVTYRTETAFCGVCGQPITDIEDEPDDG